MAKVHDFMPYKAIRAWINVRSNGHMICRQKKLTKKVPSMTRRMKCLQIHVRNNVEMITVEEERIDLRQAAKLVKRLEG